MPSSPPASSPPSGSGDAAALVRELAGGALAALAIWRIADLMDAGRLDTSYGVGALLLIVIPGSAEAVRSFLARRSRPGPP